MISDDPQEENSIAIIVLTKRQTYQALAGQLEKIEEPSLVGQQFMTIESIEAVTAYDRMNVPNDYFTNIYLVGALCSSRYDRRRKPQGICRICQEKRL